MSDTYAIAEARGKLGELARRAAQHEHITLTDRGVPTAVLISPAELADLEDALVIAKLERDRALGIARPGIPHAEVKKMLGFTDAELTEAAERIADENGR
ncbi:type II toxin-antitoxin system prevent-host-death family antitoxin [Streptomyces sp. WMMC500]|uniref:type II toxin-antitoxin system Phd/YefM family antitoxin n=1 Tax=Streptomyces sp. WMMC500 TaxID=3015154 RepID=UPI00248BF125|nr:type II toxin-antitoxin system prevent-host-death family antitoxin [Streptomyces sp. WMMC500]WBB63891.1 type II toxin-antitoxin system prevent-host-death family antitoxin [Streptomyces sp. WMMC500]